MIIISHSVTGRRNTKLQADFPDFVIFAQARLPTMIKSVSHLQLPTPRIHTISELICLYL